MKYITAAGKLSFPSLLWNVPVTEKILYLTFDDGPVPEITPWVLSLLKDYNAKATFFCIGENVKKHPNIFHQVLAEGHSIGNHTHNHLNGWKTSTEVYLQNTLLAEEAIQEHLPANFSHLYSVNLQHSPIDTKSRTGNRQLTTDTPQLTTDNRKLFRPPFGKITPNQIKKVKELNYEIVMWEVISGDYNDKTRAEVCYKEVTSQSKPGSIIVFHDSIKASGNLKRILPQILEYYKNKGYTFKSL